MFTLTTISHENAIGETSILAIIVDEGTRKKINAHFGEVEQVEGFLRCHGKQYIAGLQHTAVMAGSDNDIYYQPWFCLDGTWHSRGANSRGIRNYIKPSSGTGKLFAALETFAKENGIEAV